MLNDLRKMNFKRAFSKERLAEFMRTMTWVAPLTILIWIYAEREQTKKEKGVAVAIQPRLAGTGRIATLADPGQRNLMVDLEGPALKLDTLRQDLATGLRNGLLTIDLDATVPNGSVVRRTVDLLNEQQRFKSAGVTVMVANPPQITFQVDDLISREFVVAADPQLANFEGQPVFDPATVKISGPKRLVERITAADNLGRLIIRPDISQSPYLKVPGTHEITDVALIRPVIPGDESGSTLLEITPDRVKATFRIRQADVTYVIPAMPVFPLGPPNLMDEYKAQFEPVITNVTVQGSPSLIAALRNDTLPRRPKAILEFSRDDLVPGRSVTRRVRFDLPDGLTVSPDDLKREVEFTLVPRAKAE